MRRATGYSGGPSPVGTLVYLMAGLLVWALHLLAIYGAHVLLCLAAPSDRLVDAVIFGATALAAAGLVAFLIWQDSAARLLGLGGEGEPEVTPDDPGADAEWRAGCDRIARAIAVLSVIAVVWSGSTALFVNSCALAR